MARFAFRKDKIKGLVKPALVTGIRSALYHIGGIDDPQLEVMSGKIEDLVHNGRAHADVAIGKLKQKLK